MAASSASFLCWEHRFLETQLGGPLVVPLVLTAVLSCSSGALCTLLRVSKMMAFLGLSESRHPSATSFRHSRVVGASATIVLLELLLFGGPVLVETRLC